METITISEPTVAEETAMAQWKPPLSWYFSRAYSREIARRILNMPGARERALAATEKALADHGKRGQYFYFLKWREILENDGIDGAAMTLAGQDDNLSQAMRAASPFSGWVIDCAERDEMFASVSRKLREFREREQLNG